MRSCDVWGHGMAAAGLESKALSCGFTSLVMAT